MKTIIAAIIFLITFIQLSNSQFISNIGVKGGLTFSNQDIRYHEGYFNEFAQLSWGLNGSMFTEFLSSKYFNLIFEAGYEQRGFATTLNTFNEFGEYLGEATFRYRTEYLTAGLLSKLKFPGKPFSIYLTAGPRLDYYLGYHISSSNENDSLIGAFPSPLLEDFKKINYGVTIGAGIELSFVKRFRPFIEVNWSPMLAESYENGSYYVREYYFNIKAGIYIFDFGKRKK